MRNRTMELGFPVKNLFSIHKNCVIIFIIFLGNEFSYKTADGAINIFNVATSSASIIIPANIAVKLANSNNVIF